MSEIIHEKIISAIKAMNMLNRIRICEHVAEGASEAISKIRGNKLSQALKAMVLMAKINKTERKYYLAVVPADKAINLNAIKKYLGINDLMLAPKDRAEEVTGCVMGSVPPLTFNHDLILIADPAIKENDAVVFNAGLLTKSIFMKIDDYLAIANPTFANIAKDSSATPPNNT
jgi:Ala-tRNA(Pro) deacylase